MSATINIDYDMCNGCRTCYDSCYVDVYRWDDQNRRPIVAYPQDCVWCGACENACSYQAIEVVPNVPWQVPDPFS